MPVQPEYLNRHLQLLEMPGLIVLSIPEVVNAGSNIQVESIGEINV